MKVRTIKDIHDKEIGHKKFAWFVDTAIEDGHKITQIKEYNEKFKFQMDGYPLEFDKMPEISAKWQYELCCDLINLHKKVELAKNG